MVTPTTQKPPKTRQHSRIICTRRGVIITKYANEEKSRRAVFLSPRPKIRVKPVDNFQVGLIVLKGGE